MSLDVYGDHPPFSDDDIRVIRKALDDKWWQLDRARGDASPDSSNYRRMLLEQQSIERVQEKL